MTSPLRRRHGWLMGVAFAVGMARPVSAQGPAIVQQLAPMLEPLNFRPLPAPTAGLTLGGWVVPGHELEGSALDEITLVALQPHALRDSAVATSPILVESVGALLAGSDLRTRRMLAQDQPCLSSPASVTGFRLHILSSKARRLSSDPDLIERVAKKANVERNAFDGAVVIWGIVTADVAIGECANAAAKQKLTAELNELAWAYRAGAPTKSSPASANGDNPLVAILRAFDLNSLARERAITIKSIEIKPAGGMLSYIPRLQALGRDPATLDDEEFQQLGGAPTGPVALWAGRFYFRVVDRGRRAMIVRDLTLADRDKPLTLVANSPAKP